MTSWRFLLAVAIALALTSTVSPLLAALPQTVGGGAATALEPPPVPRRQLSKEDILDWKSIRGATISPNGQWFAYVLATEDGLSNTIFRKLSDGHELRFGSGYFPDTVITFSEDGKSAVFSKSAESGDNAAPAPAPEKTSVPRTISLVKLASGDVKEFERVRSHAFNGRKSTWLAVLTQSPQNEDAAGFELELHEIASGQTRKISGVSDFVFDAAGDRLFYTTSARDQAPSTIVLRNMITGTAKTLDSSRASYRFLALDNADGGLLAAVRIARDTATGDSTTTFVWFTDLAGAAPRRQLYEPKTDAAFPRGMVVNSTIAPSFTTDRSGIYFSVIPEAGLVTPRADSSTVAGSDNAGAAARPSLVIWHYRDNPPARDQHAVGPGGATAADTAGFLMVYWYQQKKLLQLEDSNFRTVIRTAKDRWALAIDARARESQGGADGADRHDVYAVDLRTGQKRMVLAGMQGSVSPSPDGQRFFFFTDGHYFISELATGNSRNITENVSAFRVTTGAELGGDNDTRPTLGWSADSKSLLISDGWDVWKVAANGAGAVNLTLNGRRDSIRYVAPLFVSKGDEAAGIDLKKPLYLKAYGEWSKREGVARIDPVKGGATMWLWDDAALRISRARDVDIFYYTRQTVAEFPDYYIASAAMTAGVRITRANPQQVDFEWSPGSRLFDYSSAKGVRLQGALYLPAGYESGRRYPTVVLVDEKLSQRLHRYTSPAERQPLNPAVYTSRGYAVLLPDIVYTPNDPGTSAVECIAAAVEAAVATGIVDRDHIGLFGESWGVGGYEAAFIITQTRLFAAAVAAAPVTNLVSMYSAVSAVSGSLNGASAAFSQDRFTSSYWENYDAYVRNSPVFHPTGVGTPLLIEHDDRAGMPEFSQSMEFYNVLRALGKPVVLLQYGGGSDAARRVANQNDFANKMLEFFDHHLKGAAAPAWWTAARQ